MWESILPHPVVTDKTNRNDRPDIVMLGETVKESCSIDAATPNRHHLHTAIT